MAFVNSNVGDGNVNDGAVHTAWLAKILIETSRGCHGSTARGVDPWNDGVWVKTIVGKLQEAPAPVVSMSLRLFFTNVAFA